MSSATNWHIRPITDRIDSFNFAEFKSEIEKQISSGQKHIAFELRQTQFLCIPAIKLLTLWAKELRAHGGGVMLIGPSEKMKRQITIFGSLDHMALTKVAQSLSEPKVDESPALDGSPGS